MVSISAMGRGLLWDIFPPPLSLSPDTHGAKQGGESPLGTNLVNTEFSRVEDAQVAMGDSPMAASVVRLLDPQYREGPSLHTEDQ